jgi:uncharacterized protein YdhG (YjbR/CyaY superfamily)
MDGADFGGVGGEGVVVEGAAVEDEGEGVGPGAVGGDPVDDEEGADLAVEADLLLDLAAAGVVRRLVELRDAARDVEGRLVGRLDEEDPAGPIPDQRATGNRLTGQPGRDPGVELLLRLTLSSQIILSVHGSKLRGELGLDVGELVGVEDRADGADPAVVDLGDEDDGEYAGLADEDRGITVDFRHGDAGGEGTPDRSVFEKRLTGPVHSLGIVHSGSHREASPMAATRKTTTPKAKSYEGFTAEERDAMKERAKELKSSKAKADGEADVLEKIAEMSDSDRVMAERIHAIVKADAPELTPRTWYGSPAYAKDGKIVCFFQGKDKFNTRYATLGFNDPALLDDGAMWPTAYALTEITAAVEKQIAALIKKAVG